MEKKSKVEVEVAAASVPVHPVTLSNQQFEQLLGAVRDRQLGAQDPRYPLSPSQRNVFKLFEDAAIALGVANFGTPARPLARKGDYVIVEVPEHTVSARVYAKSGVTDIFSIDNAPGPLQLLSINDPVGRIEFFDDKGLLLEVTAGEPPQQSPRAKAA